MEQEQLRYSGIIMVPSDPVFHLFNRKKERTFCPKINWQTSFRQFYNALSHRRKVDIIRQRRELTSDWIVSEISSNGT